MKYFSIWIWLALAIVNIVGLFVHAPIISICAWIFNAMNLMVVPTLSILLVNQIKQDKKEKVKEEK